MKINNFVHYDVIMAENIGNESNPHWNTYRVSGVVSDTPDKLGKIFRQNSQLLHCTKIVSVDYSPIRT